MNLVETLSLDKNCSRKFFQHTTIIRRRLGSKINSDLKNGGV